MAIYEYQCPNCKTTKEVVRKISDPEEKPKCEDPGCPMFSVEMERLISTGTGFVLKGSGWARDGYSGGKR